MAPSSARDPATAGPPPRETSIATVRPAYHNSCAVAITGYGRAARRAVTGSAVEGLPERGAHAVGPPGVGLDDVAVPEFAVTGSGVGLRRIAPGEPVAEEPPVDVGDPGTVLAGHRPQLGVELGEELDDVGPFRQADAGGLAGAVARVVDRPHDDRVALRAHQGPEPAESLGDAPSHHLDDPPGTRRVGVGAEQVVAADGEGDEGGCGARPFQLRELVVQEGLG